MSLKENVDFLKNEISTEEKFFEGFFKLEKFWKKYKIAVISSVTIVVVVVASINIKSYLQMQNKIKANKVFNSLLENPKNIQASKELEKLNPTLLTIAKHLTNQKNKEDKVIDVQFLKEIVEYNIAINKNDTKAIDKTILKSSFLLKEYAIFQKALVQTLNENYSEAKKTLELVPQNSGVTKVSNKLKHYLLTK